MGIADRIKQRMDEIEGMSQEVLAKKVGLTQPAIFKLLSGKTKRTTRFAEIAAALGVRPEWLATGQGPMTADGPSPATREVIQEIERRARNQELGTMELELILNLVKRISSPRKED